MNRRFLSISIAGLLVPVSIVVFAQCTGGGMQAQPDADACTTPAPTIQVVSRDTRFVVREHMLAAVEMQLSGEPFATAMGRDLTRYSRDQITPAPGMYYDPSPTSTGPWIDPAGFSSGVESYEYSKQPMNNLSFESGAGTSLAYGPVLNPTGATGAAACGLIRDRVQHLGAASNGTSRFIHAESTAANPLGWPGIWPTLEPFESFDPSITGTNSVAESCSITSDDDPGPMSGGSLQSDDYECDATTLHLPNRAMQVDSAITPGATGWAGWKSALWVLNYLQVMHDSQENPINTVDPGDLAMVGVPGNTIVGVAPAPATGVPGTFLGSSDIEGFQAGMMLTGLENEAQHWLTALMTTDGTTLGGFPDLMTALAYDESAPLRWFPGEIAVTETSDADCFMPRPIAFAIRSPDSHLLDLDGVLGTYASIYALTDQANAQVGGSQPAMAYFDGDPFASDDQLADGEATLHDRALAMIRVALVNMLRMHVDPVSGIPVDDVTVTGGVPTRGTTLATSTAAYTLLALRTTRRSLASVLALYSNTTPDIATLTTLIDAPPIAAGPTPLVVSGVLDTIIEALSSLLYDSLTEPNGQAWLGWDVVAGAPTTMDDSLDAHTAAVRGLLVAFLATGETRFRERAIVVFQRMQAHFYDAQARFFRTAADTTAPMETYTPLRFAMLQGTLRDVYELAATTTADSTLGSLIENQVGRLNKLVLNGWDDRNADGLVNWPDECVQVMAGLPRGALQMGERTLTGEIGSLADTLDAGMRVITTDREHDCVPEISAAGLPSALADSIVFQIQGSSRCQ